MSISIENEDEHQENDITPQLLELGQSDIKEELSV